MTLVSFDPQPEVGTWLSPHWGWVCPPEGGRGGRGHDLGVTWLGDRATRLDPRGGVLGEDAW